MITFMGHRVTAKELGKLLVEESGNLSEGWQEDHPDSFALMTKAESDSVTRQVDQQLERIRIFLGFWDLRDKVFARPQVVSDQTTLSKSTTGT